MKTHAIVLGAFLTGLLFTHAALAAVPAPPAPAVPNTADLEGPPIERDTLKKDPESRCKKIWDQMKENNDGKSNATDAKGGVHLVGDQDPQKNNPTYILAHLDDYRKMFWQTYPDKPYHEEAREALAQALFIKDIHYLQSDLVIKNTLANTPSRNADLHGGTPGDIAGQVLGQIYSSTALDGSINPDGGIPQAAMPEFEAWVEATHRALGSIGNLDTNAQLASLFKTDFGIVGADYRKACNFGGKEYQAYVLERDWAEFAAQNKIPAGFDNPQHYPEFLYYRFGERPIHDAFNIYRDMAAAMGDRKLLEVAAEKVMNAPKTQTGMLVAHVPEPVRLSPNGTKIPDYDMPIPPGVIDVYSNPLVAFEILATQDDDYRYLLYILQHKYFVNRIPIKDQSEWAFSANAAQALYKAFGKEEVLHAAHLVRTAAKRLIHGTIIDQKAIGATRNDPLEAFEDILSHKNPRGYILTALMFDANVESPASVDVDAAYKNLLAATDEKTLLADAAKMVLEKPNLASRNELAYIRNALNGKISLDKPVQTFVDDPNYLAWKKFPDNVKVSYVIRGWKQDPRHPGQFTGPSDPTIRYALSVESRTPDQLILWDTEIVYDYPSGAASKPHDSEIGYSATIAQSTTPAASGRARGRRGMDPRTGSIPQRGEETTESGDETLNIAGRSIPTHWTATTRTFGTIDKRGIASAIITKVWTSDEIPGGLVRKTEETSRTSTLARSNFYQLRETVLESFQGFTPGTPAAPASPPPAAPPAPAVVPTSQPAALPTVAPAPAPAIPPAPPAPPTPRQRRTRTPDTPVDVAAKKEIMKRYILASQREGQIAIKLYGQRRTRGEDVPKLPPEITKAHTDIQAELSAALRALRNKDYDEANKQLQSAEDNLTTVENYLNP